MVQIEDLSFPSLWGFYFSSEFLLAFSPLFSPYSARYWNFSSNVVPTFSPSVLFLKLKYPQALSWPGAEGFPSSTKACPIYLRNVSGTFPLLCIPILLLLLDFDYLGPNHFKFPCLLSLPTPKTELRMLLS